MAQALEAQYCTIQFALWTLSLHKKVKMQQKTIALVVLLALSTEYSALAQQQPSRIIYYCPPCGCSQDATEFPAPGECGECNMPLRILYTGDNVKPRPFVPLRVAILLFDGADIMDVTGPWSVFEHASTRVLTVAKSTAMVRLGATMQVKPDYTLQDMPEVDVVVLPGGGPAENNQDPEVVKWIADQYSHTDYMLSVCSGAFFLGKAGLLDGLEATTFASLLPRLETEFPNANVRNDVKFTSNGKIFTTAGLSSGIEGAFQVIAHHYGQGRAQNVANHMEYNWSPESGYSRPQLADNFIRPLQPIASLFSETFNHSSGDTKSWQYQYQLQSTIDATEVIRHIGQSLSKMDAWQLMEEHAHTISGEMSRDGLGTAKVHIALDSSTSGTMLTIQAEKKFSDSKPSSHGR